jgi:hypothetical protein
MGHERVGTLPKTKRWNVIVREMANCGTAGFDVSGIAAQTLTNVQKRFRFIEQDAVTQAAFTFLVSVAVLSRDPDNPALLQSLLPEPTERLTPLKLAKALRYYTGEAGTRTEYGLIAECAATDALALWYDQHKTQPSLFTSSENTYDVWHQAGNAAGFCELSRLFFSKYVERYLNYFLEREASTVLTVVDDRNQFHEAIQSHVDEVSRHAFETAKITQSYAAGWFNRHASEGSPSDEAMSNFLAYAFKKMRDELMVEGLAG